jgi:hypothetical protein
VTDRFARAISDFNAEDYRAALLGFEERWHTERSAFLRAMIQLCNALNQLRIGLVTAPRRSLASADALLAGCPTPSEGLNVDMLRAYIANVRACIPDDIETGTGCVEWANVPRIQLTVSCT